MHLPACLPAWPAPTPSPAGAGAADGAGAQEPAHSHSLTKRFGGYDLAVEGPSLVSDVDVPLREDTCNCIQYTAPWEPLGTCGRGLVGK